MRGGGGGGEEVGKGAGKSISLAPTLYYSFTCQKYKLFVSARTEAP